MLHFKPNFNIYLLKEMYVNKALDSKQPHSLIAADIKHVRLIWNHKCYSSSV